MVVCKKGGAMTGVVAYWFAWFSFRPETDVYFPPLQEEGKKK